MTAVRQRARARVKPHFVPPMQCLPVTALPEDTGWTFEIKFDGFRCLALKVGDKVALYSRNEKSFTARFAHIAQALAKLPGDYTIDGELVYVDETGKPNFQMLQNTRDADAAVIFYAFDLLLADGEELLDRPLKIRRKRLKALLTGAPPAVRLSPLLHASVKNVFQAVQQIGLEGVIGKHEDSLYEPGERSGRWVKRRTDVQQEFVIGGYIPGAHGFESLLLGVYEGKQLNYVAVLRNGFVPRIRKEVAPLLKQHPSKTCPFANLPETRVSRWGGALTAEKMEKCRWLKPKLVCQASFVEWTDYGKLRHPAFLAMRDDKPARNVVRET